MSKIDELKDKCRYHPYAITYVDMLYLFERIGELKRQLHRQYVDSSKERGELKDRRAREI